MRERGETHDKTERDTHTAPYSERQRRDLLVATGIEVCHRKLGRGIMQRPPAAPSMTYSMEAVGTLESLESLDNTAPMLVPSKFLQSQEFPCAKQQGNNNPLVAFLFL